ncbi:MAG: T9SS type A sorting domain-containing protein [Candidatus Eisenbacteria bacterium]|nr:T9SS type A sorting domain-containing protein [Candidatus Eisenbacteria bacterium]
MKRSPRLSIYAAACAALIVAAPARADWPASGRALCTQFGNQFLVMIAPDGSGGAIVAWGEFRFSSASTFSERVLRNGLVAPGWPVDGAQIGASNSYYAQGRGASDDAGGAYFAWGGDDLPSTHRVFLQHVTGAAGIVTGWPVDGLVVGNTTSIGSLPHVAPDGGGGVFVCWNDAPDLRIQRVRADGTSYPGWPAAGALITNVSGAYGLPYVIGDGNGGAIVAWTDSSGSGGGDVRAQRIDSGGLPASGWPADGVVVCAENGFQNVFQPIADGAGGAWLVWADDRNVATSGRDIYTQRITGSGAVATGWPVGGLVTCDAAGTQNQPRLVSDGSGGALVVWSDRRTAPDGDPFIQHLNSDGTPAAGWPTNGIAVCNGSGIEQLTLDSIVGDGVGGAIVVWSDARDSSTTARDVYAQRFDSGGSVHAGWASNGVALCTAAGDQVDVHCVSDGSGGAIVAWGDGRTGDPKNYDIYAIGVRSDGTTPALVALVGAEVAGDRVKLEWYAPERLPGGASIERRVGESPWTVIATATRDGLGYIRYEDFEIVGGARYGYRLGAAGAALTAETWVDVPLPSLSVVEAVAEPRGVVRVRFSLRSAGPARLQLFDVAGRCVRTDSPAGLGPGVHETRFPGGLSSGLYWLRLTQDGVSVRRKVLVSR